MRDAASGDRARPSGRRGGGAPARLAFYCHGSAAVGLGHVMRCRSAAEAAIEAGTTDCRIFAVGDGCAQALLSERPAPYWLGPDDSAAVEAVLAYDPHVVYFDMLRAEQDHFARLARGRATVALSPIFSHLGDVDLIFHRTSIHPEAPDAAARDRGRPRWRAGLRYAIIRPGCGPIATAHYLESLRAGQPLGIAITMGGGDARNKTLRVLRALRTLERPMVFWVLLGEGYAHSYEELVECVRRDTAHEIILAKTCAGMWRVAARCAVAILAAGTVTYEAAAARLPSINLFDDPAQQFLVRELVERGAAFNAGAPFDAALDRTRTLLDELDRDRSRLRAAHEAARDLIDGLGARRVVAETLEHFGLRRAGPAAPADAGR